MKNMKKRTVTWLYLLFSLLMCTSAKAESITSPNGLLKILKILKSKIKVKEVGLQNI